MKAPRSFLWITATLILCGIVAGGYLFHKEQKKEKAANLQAKIDAKVAKIKAKQQGKTPNENSWPKDDIAMGNAVPKSYPRPASVWKTTEKLIYQKLLSTGKYDVLVVPFQVQQYAVDRPTRSLMTAELAMLITQAQEVKIPDPYLVARALGDGTRRLDPDEVYAFADKLGVKKIIWSYVGHNRKNNMTLTFQVQESAADGSLNAQTKSVNNNIENIVFSDEEPPIEAFQFKLPEILKAIVVDSSKLSAPKPLSVLGAAKLPEDPLTMAKEKPNPAYDALYFQVLAYTVPFLEERTKERFAEKSYLALLNMSEQSPDFKALKARALMLLGSRPAALKILGEAKTPEEKELFAALNGNLPDIEHYGAQIKPEMKKLIAKFDASNLSTTYLGANPKKLLAAADSFKMPGKLWPFLLKTAFTQRDDWAVRDLQSLKQVLDDVFPINEYSLDSLLKGAASIGDIEKIQSLMELSSFNHIRKFIELNTNQWCCGSKFNHPEIIDYLDLLEAITNDKLLFHATFLAQTQGSPGRAIDYLNSIESIYNDHPRFSLTKGYAQVKLAASAESSENKRLLDAANHNFFNTLYWEQGQTSVAGSAFENIVPAHNYFGSYDNFYVSDVPFRDNYPLLEQDGDPKYWLHNADAALRHSTCCLDAFEPIYKFYLESSDQKSVEELFKSIEGRFKGNPSLYSYRATNSLRNGDEKSAEKNYRENISIQPTDWQAYTDLGTLLIEQGHLDKAANVFMEYPGFDEDSEEHRVAISQYAYRAGSKFYWLGEFSLAKPFYEIAIRDSTGSGGDITSRARLNLLEGNYTEALMEFQNNGKRYKNTDSYRDFLGLLYAMNETKSAWDAFNTLSSQMDDSHIWETVMVGHRKEGKSEADVTAWVKQKVQQNIGKNVNRAATYLFREGVTDRIPTQSLASILDSLALPVWRNNYPNRWVVVTSVDGIEYRAGPRESEDNSADMRPLDSKTNPQKTRVKSGLFYFAETYFAIRENDFELAWKSIQEASKLYDITFDDRSGELLPYYTLAAIKTGNTEVAKKYISDFKPVQKRFNYYLAKAILAGMGGKTEESVAFLKTALYKRPLTEDQPLQTEYQYADICKLLFDATGKPQYKEFALDWAQKNQVFQPWFSWAYAMEAIYTDNKADRKRAIAMTAYLDPQSEMLKQIPEKEREAAVTEFKRINPFLKKNKEVLQDAI